MSTEKKDPLLTIVFFSILITALLLIGSIIYSIILVGQSNMQSNQVSLPSQESTTLSACQDNIDNDNDGFIDTADFGCENLEDTSEVNNGLSECSDGIDNDNDFLIDHEDPHCETHSDQSESSPSENSNVTSQPTSSGGSGGGGSGGGGSGGDDSSDEEIPEEMVLFDWPPTDFVPTEQTYAYAWSGTFSIDNMVVMHQLDRLGNASFRVDSAVNRTNDMPEGHKVILVREQAYATGPSTQKNQSLSSHYEDSCRNETGGIIQIAHPDFPGENITFNCIWWDNGVAKTSSRFTNFFNAFKEANGTVDSVILDSEVGLRFIRLRMTHDDPQGDPPPNISLIMNTHLNAIQNDQRYLDINNSILDQLLAYGYFPSDMRLNDTYALSQQDLLPPESEINPLAWRALMRERIFAYINNATYHALLAHYPNVSVSDFGASYWIPELRIPDKNGIFWKVPGSSGQIAGTHQSRAHYGTTRPGITIADLDGDGSNEEFWSLTSFNHFRYLTNVAREAYLANSTAPLRPWIHEKSWGGDGINPNILEDSFLYEELIIHLGLLNTDAFLFWNPSLCGDPIVCETQATFLSNTLKELDLTTGYQDKTILTTNITDWNDDFIHTGVRINDYTIWRYTPELQENESLSDILIEETQDIIFLARNSSNNLTITFPNSDLISINNSASQEGYWIASPAELTEPIRSIAVDAVVATAPPIEQQRTTPRLFVRIFAFLLIVLLVVFRLLSYSKRKTRKRLN